MVRATQILLLNEKQGQVISLLEELENVSVHRENKRYAMFNLMRYHFQSGDFEDAQRYAEVVLTLKNLEVKVKWDAYEILAQSSIALKDSLKAEEAFKILEKAPIDKLAAEAYYFRADQNHRKKNYEESNEVIALLSQKFSSQPYWAAKSLLLMAQNFYAVKDAFQATYILESLIGNYDQFPEISQKGKTLLDQIEKEQAEQNASLSEPNISNEVQ